MIQLTFYRQVTNDWALHGGEAGHSPWGGLSHFNDCKSSTPLCFSGDLHRPTSCDRARQQCPAHVHRLLEVRFANQLWRYIKLMFRKLSGHYHCSKCGWPLCGDRCRNTKIHQRECALFQVFCGHCIEKSLY